MLAVLLFLITCVQFSHGKVDLSDEIVKNIVSSNHQPNATLIAEKFSQKFGSNENFLVLLYKDSCEPYDFSISSTANHGKAVVNDTTVIVLSYPTRKGRFIPNKLVQRHLEIKYNNITSAIDRRMLDTLAGNMKLHFVLTVRGHFLTCGFSIAVSPKKADYGSAVLFGSRLIVYAFE